MRMWESRVVQDRPPRCWSHLRKQGKGDRATTSLTVRHGESCAQSRIILDLRLRAGQKGLPFRLEGTEPPLKLPLRGGLFASFQERLASGRRLVSTRRLSLAPGCCRVKYIRLGPQAGAGQKVVFKTSARQGLEVRVAEVIVHGCANIFVRNIDAAYALVVG